MSASLTASWGIVVSSLTTDSGGAGTNGIEYALPGNPAAVVTWQVEFSSAPSAVNVILQGSLDDVTYFTLDTSTATAGEIRNIITSANFVRARIVSKTGGGTTTVSLTPKQQPVSTISFTGGSIVGDVDIVGNLTVSETSAFTGISTFLDRIRAANGTAALPAYSFTGSTNTGMYSGGGSTVAIGTNGVGILGFQNGNTANFTSGTVLGWSASSDPFGTADTTFARNAAKAITLGPTTGVTLRWSTADLFEFRNFSNSAGAGIVLSSLRAPASSELFFYSHTGSGGFRIDTNGHVRLASNTYIEFGANNYLITGGTGIVDCRGSSFTEWTGLFGAGAISLGASPSGLPAGRLNARTIALPNTGTAPTAGEATLGAGGTITVSTTAIGASDVVVLTRKTMGGTVGTLTYTISAGTSFTINSSSAIDSSVVSWAIVKVF